jgi:NYN domain
MRAIVYVDGFNLYYGALKDTPYRWLDLGALCSRLLKRDQIVGIKYFTALSTSAPWKSSPPVKSASQGIYLRALQTVPGLSVYYGHFLSHPVARRLVHPPRQGSPHRHIWHTEEKGSDVNLASHLLIDGFRARYDLAVIVSNDSDLTEPVRFVRQELNAPVGILNPHPRRSWELSPPHMPVGSFYRPIRGRALPASQFRTTLTDEHASFSKPNGW